jgi:hypothetical protein
LYEGRVIWAGGRTAIGRAAVEFGKFDMLFRSIFDENILFRSYQIDYSLKL